jgi:hypothetical protein
MFATVASFVDVEAYDRAGRGNSSAARAALPLDEDHDLSGSAPSCA